LYEVCGSVISEMGVIRLIYKNGNKVRCRVGRLEQVSFVIRIVD